jgi:uncharacterized membrane protein
VLLASTLPLALGTLLSDWAYSRTHEVQWINFAAWLIVGTMLFAVPALLWALVDAARADVRRDRGRLAYLATLLVMVLVALVDTLVHTRDAWATMPAGLLLSALVALLAFASVWLGFSRGRERRGR